MNTNRLSKLSVALVAGAIPAVNALAGVFVIADDACPVAKGDLEFHIHSESSVATNHGSSIASATSLEFACGVAETLEVDVLLDFGYDYMSGRYARKTGESRLNDFNCTGISVGFKNQILDPENAENPFGLALVGGFAWGWADANRNSARDVTFELGLNFQKNLLDGDLMLAFTPGVAFTSVKGNPEEGGTDSTFDSTEYSLAAGASYHVGGGFRLGVEGVYVLAYDADGFVEDQFYAGPNFCYEAENWWVTVAVAPRLFTSADDMTVAAQFGYAF